ncbi:phage antirepressor protein [Candidatus Woesearchaeota archaeon]|nr:phage antirepressor protein [Candidatus Woesearchaeota archaeon]
MEKHSNLVVFDDKKIRRIWHNDQWYFSVVDIIGSLAESSDARNYWKVLKHRLLKEGSEVVTKCNQLKLQASDGKYYESDCANTETLFRLIQSIPSPKAEPFKLWLAQVGYERVQEIENPELAQERMKELYRQKGYSEEWIEKRVRGIAVRQELVDEWKKRDVKNIEFGILTNEISKAAFDKTVDEYKQHKKLKKENLRDHMNDLELIFTMLGEASTTTIAKARDAKGFDHNKAVARKGGSIAGEARKQLEIASGKSIVSQENYLDEPEKVKKKRLK